MEKSKWMNYLSLFIMKVFNVETQFNIFRVVTGFSKEHNFILMNQYSIHFKVWGYVSWVIFLHKVNCETVSCILGNIVVIQSDFKISAYFYGALGSQKETFVCQYRFHQDIGNKLTLPEILELTLLESLVIGNTFTALWTWRSINIFLLPVSRWTALFELKELTFALCIELYHH